MASPAGKSTIALGFLTVVEHKQHGLFGGYLVLNQVGRPLEFHCTAPVKPNRAQEILYGRWSRTSSANRSAAPSWPRGATGRC